MDKKHTNNEYVHDYFLNYMKEHGYTKDKFAELLEVKPYNVYTSFPAEDSEKPPRNFSLDEIVTFCIKTGTSLDDILELDARRSSDEKKPETFRDILERMFYIEDDPCCRTIINIEDDCNLSVRFTFDDIAVPETLKKWEKIIDLSDNEITELWRERVLDEAAELKKEYKYTDDFYFASRILDRILTYKYKDICKFDFSAPTDIRLGCSKAEFQLVSEYRIGLTGYLAHSDSNSNKQRFEYINKLFDIYEKCPEYLKFWNGEAATSPAYLDEELPF